MGAIKVLDHGYVRFIEAWGHGDAGTSPIDYDSDSEDYECGIIEAARQSTQGNFRGWDQDAKLLGYLFNSRPQHATPFEFAGMVVEVQAPIAVFREWHRHRVQSLDGAQFLDGLDDTGFNEMSARYAPLPNVNYMPAEDRCLLADPKNKQAGSVGGVVPDRMDAVIWLGHLEYLYALAEQTYSSGLGRGIPKEVARLCLPVGRYSRMRVATNLRNWLAFITLRADPAAQLEIRQFANAVGAILAVKFPRTWAMYCDREAA